ncbi:MAG: SufD family Fe-S cluster assembly protein [Lachnospiraceae bacterium]|nr:SufD family Fe-S cluster assembly protein [Lachnospiraceae bacterium]
METKEYVINPLPVKTWNHLRMNSAKVDIEALAEKDNIDITAQGVTQKSVNASAIDSGLGHEFDALVTEAVPVFKAFETDADDARIRADIAVHAGEASVTALDITAKDGQTLTFITDLKGDKDASGSVALQVRLHAGKGSVINLIQAQRSGAKVTVFNDLAGELADDASVNLYQLFMEADKTYGGLELKLNGDRTSFISRTGYAVAGDEKMDMNYVVRFVGKKGMAQMKAMGSLSDRARKLYRQTIDFINGSAGSSGEEREEVLMLDPDCVNGSIPLILCAEENVEGEHGATIGQADDEMLFYMEARGIDKKTAIRMLARAKLDAVCAMIPDEEFSEEMAAYLKGKDEYGESEE